MSMISITQSLSEFLVADLIFKFWRVSESNKRFYILLGTWITCGLNPLGFAYEFIKYNVLDDGSGYDVCSENAKVVTSFPTNHWFGLSYFHSFGITENFIIFLEQSLVLSYWHLFVAIMKNNPISNCFKTHKNFETRIHLADKRTGKIVRQRFKTIPQFSFHYINCFEVRESNGTLRDICIDICSYNIDTFDIELFTYENLYSGNFKIQWFNLREK